MLLRALKDIPTSVNLITAGSNFHEGDPERAADWVAQGYAEQVLGRPPKPAREPAPPGAPASMPAPSERWRLHWPGATVAIVASGESLSTEQCAALALWQAQKANARVIAINTSFRMAPFADILYACDGAWWRAVDPETKTAYVNEAKQHFSPDALWTQDEMAAKEFGLQWIKSTRSSNLSLDKDLIAQGANSALQAMNLAVHAGAKTLLLFGVDCKGKHWHGDHPSPLSNGLPHKMWKENFAVFAADLEKAGIEVINCSPTSVLNCFPKRDYREVLA